MNAFTRSLTTASLAALFSTSADAALLYENPFPADPAGGICSPCSTLTRSATSFDLAVGSTVTDVSALLHDVSVTADQFIDELEIAIYGDDFASVLFSQVVGRSLQTRDAIGGLPGDSLAVIHFDITDLYLDAGRYFISLFGLNGRRLGWPSVFAAGSEWVQVSGTVIPLGTPTIQNNIGLAVRIQGFEGAAQQVPEPASIALLVFGLAGIAWTRRRSAR